MGENTKKTPIILDDVTYHYEDLTQQQQMLVNHIQDLDRKIGGASFSLDQLNVGKAAFVKLLKEELTKVEETEVASELVQ
jgi:cell division septum initiation protein DivIVA